MNNLIILFFLHCVLFADFGTNSMSQLLPTVEKSKISLLIYTQAEPSETEIALTVTNPITEVSQFNIDLNTVLFIHGWNETVESESCVSVKDTLLANINVNVIIVNWDEYADEVYLLSAYYVSNIGTYLGEFLSTFSQTYNYPLTDVTVVGYDLGAHIAGFIGKYTNGTLGTIVGLDPSGSPFLQTVPDSRLNEDDAQNVQAIHTNAGIRGVSYSLGKSDFWPNAGIVQTGCAMDTMCSHALSWKFYVESLGDNQFYAKQCNSYFQYLSGACSSNSKSLMGGLNITTATGSYYLSTNAESPYGEGDI